MKADGSVGIHADDRAFKPLNWMSSPCWLEEQDVLDQDDEPTGQKLWIVENKGREQLRILIDDIISDESFELGIDPGLQKDGVEQHLQELLAEHIDVLGKGFTLIRREFPTAIGPVDILCRDGEGQTVAVEIKRNATIDGVEQLTRYLEMLNRDPVLAPVRGILAAQTMKPQAKILAEDRGLTCAILDYDDLRGIESPELRLF